LDSWNGFIELLMVGNIHCWTRARRTWERIT